MAAAMASAIPVLPLVASISVSPGLMSPRASACMIIDSAGRSFTEPAGLLPSSLARMTFEVSPGMRLSLTNGVLPTKSSMDEYVSGSRLEHLLHILRHTLLDVQERFCITAVAQRADVGLGVALVFAAQGFGERDVLDQALLLQLGETQRVLAFGTAQGVDGRRRHVVEALRLSGAEIEDSRFVRVIEKIHVHFDHIFHRHEVAHLPAIGVAVAAFEQLHLALGAILVEEVERDRGHAPLVLFARAVHVEIAQADDLRVALVQAAPH